MNDQIKINLAMADSNYPLTINREDEEIVRNAAKQVEQRVNLYRKNYPQISLQRITTMVAYQFALENLKLMDRNDTKPITDKIATWNKLLEAHFNE